MCNYRQQQHKGPWYFKENPTKFVAPLAITCPNELGPDISNETLWIQHDEALLQFGINITEYLNELLVGWPNLTPLN